MNHAARDLDQQPTLLPAVPGEVAGVTKVVEGLDTPAKGGPIVSPRPRWLLFVVPKQLRAPLELHEPMMVGETKKKKNRWA